MRYRVEGAPTWREGHPLHRIRPEFAETPSAGSVPDAFAWPVIDLLPGTRYEVEVTVTSGATSDVRNGVFTTRSLPAVAGTPNKTIASGSSLATIQAAMNALNPGDVIEFEVGVYTLGGDIQISRSGTPALPIVIRGATRNGVVLAGPWRQPCGAGKPDLAG